MTSGDLGDPQRAAPTPARRSAPKRAATSSDPRVDGTGPNGIERPARAKPRRAGGGRPASDPLAAIPDSPAGVIDGAAPELATAAMPEIVPAERTARAPGRVAAKARSGAGRPTGRTGVVEPATPPPAAPAEERPAEVADVAPSNGNGLAALLVPPTAPPAPVAPPPPTEAPAPPVSAPPALAPTAPPATDAPGGPPTDVVPAVADAPAESRARTSVIPRRRPRPRVRRVTRVVRHIDTWSVFKVALVFNAVLYLVCLTAGVLLWNVAHTTGTVDNVERFFEQFGWETFEFNGGELYHNAWIAGLFLAIGFTGLAVLLATLFNLITDLVGGVRVSVLEEEVVARQFSRDHVVAARAEARARRRGAPAATEPPPTAPVEAVPAPGSVDHRG